MMTYPYSIRRRALLLSTVFSGALLLAACASFENFRRDITGTRPAQAVEGPRRPPMLNPLVEAGAYQKDRMPRPALTEVPDPDPYDVYDPARKQYFPADRNPAAPVPTAAQNPYDLYDASGNPVAPKTTAEAPPAQGNFVSRLFGGTSAAGEDTVRKPLADNPVYSAPAPPASQADSFSSAQPLPAADMMAPAEEPAPQERGSWLSRTMEKLSSPFKAEPEEAPPTAQADMLPPADEPYPMLSSVPPTPPQFTSVRSESREQMEALTAEHMQAQGEKQGLMNEPSQLDAMSPVDAAAKTVPPVNVQPASKDAPTPQEPVLLGHVSSPPTGMQPLPVRKTEPLAAPDPAPAQPALPEEARGGAVPEPQAATRQPYWWEGWNLFGDKNESVTTQHQDEQAQILDETAPAFQADTSAAPAPLLPLLSPAEIPPLSEAASDAPQDPAQSTGNALPSPAILQQIKTLPPSRYSTRMQSRTPTAY